MMQDALKIFEAAKSPMEKDTVAFLTPLVTEEIAKSIMDKKLTLSGCMTECGKKGQKFKTGNFAAITYQQHMTWCCEYFGITPPAELKRMICPEDQNPAPAEAAKKPALTLSFDDLF